MRLRTGATAALAACQPRATPPATVIAVADPAEVACVAAVQAETGTTGASVRSSQVTAAGTSVMVSVPGSEAPWSCLASSDGGSRRFVMPAAEARCDRAHRRRAPPRPR